MAKMSSAQRRTLGQILAPQDAMILDAFQSETYVQGKVDVQNEPLYDMFALGAVQLTQNNSALFTAVGPASGKTLGQTNLSQSRRLPAPEAFSVLGIRLYWNEDMLIVDLLNIVGASLANFAFEFYLGQKCYNRGPLWYYAAGGGFVNVNANTAAPALGLFTNGIAGRSDMHKLAIPLVIENQGEFYAQLAGGPYLIIGTFSLMCLLDGFHARGVQ